MSNTTSASFEVKGKDLTKFTLVNKKKIAFTEKTLEKNPELKDLFNLTLTYEDRMINIRNDHKAAKYFLDDTKMEELFSVVLTPAPDYIKGKDKEGKDIIQKMFDLSAPVTRKQAKNYLENDYDFAVLEQKIAIVKSGSFVAKDIVLTEEQKAVLEEAGV